MKTKRLVLLAWLLLCLTPILSVKATDAQMLYRGRVRMDLAYEVNYNSEGFQSTRRGSWTYEGDGVMLWKDETILIALRNVNDYVLVRIEPDAATCLYIQGKQWCSNLNATITQDYGQVQIEITGEIHGTISFEVYHEIMLTT
jgi:hypothetical protein